MATHLVPLLNAHIQPDVSGTVYFEPSSISLSNDRYPAILGVFASQSLRQGLYGKFRVPNNYVGTAKVEIEWITASITGDCRWEFDYRAIADGESYDPTTDQESAGVTDTAAGTGNLLNRATITLTGSNFAAGDEVPFYLVRDAADAADTLANTAFLVGAYFSYADV